MIKLFDEKTGYLLLDEMICQRESFQKIVKDSLVTDDEVMAQANAVIGLLKQLDEKLDAEEKKLVAEALSEMAVLYQINALKEER